MSFVLLLGISRVFVLCLFVFFAPGRSDAALKKACFSKRNPACTPETVVMQVWPSVLHVEQELCRILRTQTDAAAESGRVEQHAAVAALESPVRTTQLEFTYRHAQTHARTCLLRLRTHDLV